MAIPRFKKPINLNIIVLLFCIVLLPAIARQASAQTSREALFYHVLENSSVQCRLCPRKCTILPGRRGFCGTRLNREGKLYTLVYEKAVAIHVDPIEKKPLFHFLPGSRAFSIATAGCNLRCKFCQNYAFSQKMPEEVPFTDASPQELVEKALGSGAGSIAYTYNEPTVFYEYMLETAKLARAKGLKNVMHSCGYINEEPLKELLHYMDGVNIDLKGFSDDFYLSMSQASLQPVLESLKIIKESGVHLEITNLLLTGYNDDPSSVKQMCIWIKDNLGLDVPLHFSRAFPQNKLLSLIPTPVTSLEKARDIALETGIRYVYIGNVAGHQGENTYCPACKALLIRRSGYTVSENKVKKGICPYCSEKITGVWS